MGNVGRPFVPSRSTTKMALVLTAGMELEKITLFRRMSCYRSQIYLSGSCYKRLLNNSIKNSFTVEK